jgi:hypothetical protein
MADEVKKSTFVFDADKATKHLDSVEAEFLKLGKYTEQEANPEKGIYAGHPKAGCNAFQAIRVVVHPLRVGVADSNQHSEALMAKIMSTKAETPTVEKFWRNPINGSKTTIAVSQPPVAPKL